MDITVSFVLKVCVFFSSLFTIHRFICILFGHDIFDRERKSVICKPIGIQNGLGADLCNYQNILKYFEGLKLRTC